MKSATVMATPNEMAMASFAIDRSYSSSLWSDRMMAQVPKSTVPIVVDMKKIFLAVASRPRLVPTPTATVYSNVAGSELFEICPFAPDVSSARCGVVCVKFLCHV